MHPALLALSIALTLASVPARGERTDRQQQIVVEADKPGTLDLQRRVVVFNGNVQITQGSLQIQAERIEVHELAGGYRRAIASGAPGRPASYRQRRDVAGESVEGAADRIEYDSQAGTLRLIGSGAIRRLRDGQVVDEITGALITWDDGAELFSVQGSDGPASTPGGRVRAVLTPPSAASGVPR